jgi:hypothetical protein
MKASINWAHIALAQFMNEKFIERALTVNFDNLMARACGLLSLYPAIYDFASAPTSDVALIVSPAIVMSRYSSQEIDEIADTLRSARDRAKPAHILFGAGCSRAAGIPLASEIVAKIGELYRGRWRGLTETDQQKYGACMKLLSPNERRDLLAPYLMKASRNCC